MTKLSAAPGTRTVFVVVAVAVLALASCSEDSPMPGLDGGPPADGCLCFDAGLDAGPTDDAGPTADAGTADDAGASDAGDVADAGTLDAGEVADAGLTNVDAGGMCAPPTHRCDCATGYYCLMFGAACLSPSAPCP